MPRRNKTRYLRMEIKWKTPPQISREEVRSTLLASIVNGSYEYPRNWLVGIYWSNKAFGQMKSGEFRREMQASRESSPGFDIAVSDYLRSMP